jgi:hypothetical protein
MTEVWFHSSVISSAGTVLARYVVACGEREVVAYGHASGVAIYDCRADGKGERFLVDRGVLWEGALEGLVLEYVAHAERIGCPPASVEGIGLLAGGLEVGEAAVLLGAV